MIYFRIRKEIPRPGYVLRELTCSFPWVIHDKNVRLETKRAIFLFCCHGVSLKLLCIFEGISIQWVLMMKLTCGRQRLKTTSKQQQQKPRRAGTLEILPKWLRQQASVQGPPKLSPNFLIHLSAFNHLLKIPISYLISLNTYSE